MIYLCIVIKKQIVIMNPKRNFRVIIEQIDGKQSIIYRCSLNSLLCLVKKFISNLYPFHGNVTYYLQAFNPSLDSFVTFTSVDYNCSDIPF